ncbi:hypothetical protein AAFF_G00369980 [Aldrovandia affinis]|uniref:PiggyBac transposable element-derived protein domain-containing protein n=1 Tax=Aldrovandia affinis TaxID=143900 RepID=A0AAD7VYY9_9TELE|nr:hypothetical protein AAFF_G00369980 [Aldrovandia affinis]
MTNMYALQNATSSFRYASPEEIKALVGLHLAVGVMKLPRVRMYWDSTMDIGLFRDALSRDRFFQLRSNLHIVNNLERPAGDKDVFYKVRPLYDSIRKRCLELSLDENLCIDEQVKYFDNRPVLLASNFVGVGDTDEVVR